MTNALFAQWRARSRWYDHTHEVLATSLRGFLAREAAPYIEEWESAGEVVAGDKILALATTEAGGTEDILRDLAGRQLGYSTWYGTR